MITSNFFDRSKILYDKGGSFYLVSDSMAQYAKEAESHISEKCCHGGNDHFISTMKAIEDLWRCYDVFTEEEILKKINSTSGLKKWFAIIVSMIIFGRNGNNQLCTETLSYDNRPYLAVWKNKFCIKGVDDNSLSGGSYDEGLNVYEFISGDLDSAAGCCSERYYIIPSKEIIRNNKTAWKELYFSFTGSSVKIEQRLNELDIIQKILLKMSVASMPDNKPLKIIKDIIASAVDCEYEVPEQINGIRIGDISYFRTACEGFTEDIFAENLCIMKIGYKYASLYPFEESISESIEKGIFSAEDLRLNVNKKNKYSDIDSADISGLFVYTAEFENSDGSEAYVRYRFKKEKKYTKENIRNSFNLRTFCMYPDVPLEYEDMCTQYTYFSNSNSFVINSMDDSDDEMESIDLSKRRLGYDGNIEQICFDGIFSEAVLIKAQTDLVISFSAHQRHIIKVISPDNEYIGCVVNLRTLEYKRPSLLPEGFSVGIDLRHIEINRPQNVMDVYVDFGSSSSTIGYRINNGIMEYGSNIWSFPIVRELLSEYDRNSYINYINSDMTKFIADTVPSVSVKYNGGAVTDHIPNHEAWMPFKKRFTDFEKRRIDIDVSHKTELISGKNTESPEIIISSLCFTALCRAVNTGCSIVNFYPSLPNEEYAEPLIQIWNSVLESMEKVFKIRTDHMLKSVNKHFLYESIAFSNGTIGIGNNVLTISVDMGDSTTDMSAVFSNEFGEKKICGYSSLEYAGKNLLKESVRNIIGHMDVPDTAAAFMSGNDKKQPFFIPVCPQSPANNIILNISKKFFPGANRTGLPRNESWQNNFMELLETASVNTEKSTNIIDLKAQTDIIMRYTLLMPVVRDFVETALSICSANSSTAIRILFSGGASKGFLLADKLTESSGVNYMKRAEKYFSDYFHGKCRICNVEIPSDNSKEQLIKGLSQLSVVTNNMGITELYLTDQKMTVDVCWDEIAPKSVNLNESRMKNCSNFKFRKIMHSEDIRYNSSQRKKAENCIPENAYNALSAFLNELIAHFITEKEFVSFFKKSFVADANPLTRSAINKQFVYKDNEMTSFRRASDSEVYPEMIRSTAFLFETSRLLSECFGLRFKIEDTEVDAMDEKYNFGI